MALAQEMESDDPPAVVIYVMIPQHVKRNYIRMSWVKTLAKYDRDHPHFELIDGKPMFKGVVGVPNSLTDTPEMRDKEIELTKAFLIEMQNISHNRQVPFIVILLGKYHLANIYKAMIENNIKVLDLSGIKLEGFSSDGHPNRNDHRRIAEMILDSFVPKVLESASTINR
jgi:hypothetical protein